jgi:hypothetical protein
MFFPDDSRTISPYANLAAECVTKRTGETPVLFERSGQTNAQNI